MRDYMSDIANNKGVPKYPGLSLLIWPALSFTILSELSYIKVLLSQIGPAISAILFIVAGIFYAFGQLMTPQMKANFHSTAINLIIGAIVVAVLSVAATSFAIASTHLIGNLTNSTPLG